MATLICNAPFRTALTCVATGVAIALGAAALIAPEVSAQESRRPGGGEGRQFEGGARGPGGARAPGGPGGRADGAARPAGGERSGERGAGGEGARVGNRTVDDQASADSSESEAAQTAAPMQFDASPVSGNQRGNQGAAAPAVAPVAAQQNGWLNEIAEMEARLTLLEKRNELDERMIDSQLKLMEKRAELESLVRNDLDARLLDSQIQVRTKRSELDTLLRENTDATLAYLPSVVSIIGAKNKYQAQLYFPSGRISYAREGDLIAPGVRVARISASGMEVSMVLGDSAQPQQVPLGFVSMAERRGDNEHDEQPSFGDVMRNIFRPSGMANGAAGVRPLSAGAAAGAAARAAGAARAGN